SSNADGLGEAGERNYGEHTGSSKQFDVFHGHIPWVIWSSGDTGIIAVSPVDVH
ncbi:TPA: hypothetical protein I8426_005492, partial [Citrobacter freundii]|nr:hypothetical protein [Citrobacter freundii]